MKDQSTEKEKSPLTDEQIGLMGEDALGSFDPDAEPEEGTTREESTQDDNKSDNEETADGTDDAKETGDDEAEKAPDKDETDDAEKVVTDSDGDGEEEKEEEGKSGDPLKDTQAAFTKARMELAEAKKQIAELKKAQIAAKRDGFDFSKDDILNREELEELKENDPDAYMAYLEDYSRYVSEVAPLEQQEKELERQEAERTQNEIYERTVDNVTRFAQSIGIDIKNEQQFNSFLESKEFTELTQYLTERPHLRNNGVFDAEMLEAHFLRMNREWFKKQGAVDVRKETVQSIKKAQQGGSKLDRESKTNKSERAKELGKLTQDEIDKMGEKELAQYLESLE